MSPDASFAVRPARWPGERPALRCIREAVFVVEQQVPPELEWDGLDPECTHVLAEAAGEAVGTARMTPTGHIGRMAVLPPWRGRGIGSALLADLLDTARARALPGVVLNAQNHALAFYARHGFTAEGDEFLDAGIPHRRMVRDFLGSESPGAAGGR